MLRKRIEKLELGRPRSVCDLVRNLERRALASLSPRDRVLVASSQNSGHRARPPQEVESANKHYQEALARLLQDIGLEELDSMLAFCGSTSGNQPTIGAS